MTRTWAKCCECGGEVWFDAWVDLHGEVCGGPYDNTYCETCEGEASYTVVDGPRPEDMEEDDEGADSV